MLKKTLFVCGQALAAAILGLSISGASAQDAYPSREVKMVVGYNAGGSNDVIARLLSEHLTKRLGQPFIVENKPGAAQDVAVRYLMNAEPDGYTLMYMAGASAAISNGIKGDKAIYSMSTDLQPVALVTSFAQILTIAPSFGTPDLASFVAKVKASPPNTYNYASTGIGTIIHGVVAGLMEVAGLEMEHVPYEGGGELNVAVLADEAQLGAGSPVTVKTFTDSQNRKLLPIAIAGPKRNPAFPDVPTVAEAGFPEYDEMGQWLTWQAVVAPKGTPPEVLAKLNTEINEILKDPAVVALLGDQGMESMTGATIQDAEAYFAKEAATWKTLVERLGMNAAP